MKKKYCRENTHLRSQGNTKYKTRKELERTVKVMMQYTQTGDHTQWKAAYKTM
jgi:hypothetical protein